MTLHRILALLLVLAGLTVLPAQAQTSVGEARLWPAPDRTRLVLELGGPVSHHLFTLKNPDRVVIDLQDSRLAARLNALDLSQTPIRDIRSAPRHGTDLRIVLDMSRPVPSRATLLRPNDKYGYRLVVDLGKPLKAAPAKPVMHDNSDEHKRDIIVVVDAGHGGEDPGATGPDGVHEKNVTLEIAQRLQRLINRYPGFKAVMTRDGDYYVGLRERTVKARQDNADLFVSVHADSYHDTDAHGASVYALSQRGATSETARWLAQSENRADLIGGVGGVSLDDKDDALAGVLLDLSMTASLNASLGVGSKVLAHLDNVARLHRSRVEQAAFVVLKSPDIPSILVETGFISNPREERELNSSAHQQALAEAIFNGVLAFFQQTPPPGTLMAWEKHQGQTSALRQQYRIQAGDTLSDIAQRNQTSVSRLMEVNGLRSDQVEVGQVIRIPTS